MYELNYMKNLILLTELKKSNNTVFNFLLYQWVIFLLLLISSNVFTQDTKPVIAVLHLDNEGGVSETVIDTICNRISMLIEKTQRYYVFKREFISPVLEESRFTVLNGIYSLKEELAAAGTLLSVDEIIGGIIYRENSSINIILKRIDVHNQKQVSSVQFTSAVSKQEFMGIQLPILVERILESK